MPEVQVVTGAPFSGKGQFVRDEIARREREGELGLVALDWTALYTALVPGVQSSFRDEAVSDTGAPRMVAYVFEIIAAAIAAGSFTVTSSHSRHVRRSSWRTGSLTARLTTCLMSSWTTWRTSRTGPPGRLLLDEVGPRGAAGAGGAGRGAGGLPARGAGGLPARGAGGLPARGAGLLQRSSGAGGPGSRSPALRPRVEGGEVKRPFDRELWERGLTPRGREARNELIERGNPEPTPAQVMAWLLRDRR